MKDATITRIILIALCMSSHVFAGNSFEIPSGNYAFGLDTTNDTSKYTATFPSTVSVSSTNITVTFMHEPPLTGTLVGNSFTAFYPELKAVFKGTLISDGCMKGTLQGRESGTFLNEQGGKAKGLTQESDPSNPEPPQAPRSPRQQAQQDAPTTTLPPPKQATAANLTKKPPFPDDDKVALLTKKLLDNWLPSQSGPVSIKVPGIQNRTIEHVDTRAMANVIRRILEETGKVTLANDAANTTQERAHSSEKDSLYVLEGHLMEIETEKPSEPNLPKTRTTFFRLTLSLNNPATNRRVWTDQIDFTE